MSKLVAVMVAFAGIFGIDLANFWFVYGLWPSSVGLFVVLAVVKLVVFEIAGEILSEAGR